VPPSTVMEVMPRLTGVIVRGSQGLVAGLLLPSPLYVAFHPYEPAGRILEIEFGIAPYNIVTIGRGVLVPVHELLVQYA